MSPEEERLRAPEAFGAPREVDLFGDRHEGSSSTAASRKRLTRLAFLATAILLLAAAAAAFGGRPLLAKGRTVGLVRLDGLTHETKWGPVPDVLAISGIQCREEHSNEKANGEYRFQGTTLDGRPYYKHRNDSWSFWLYYDKECDGDEGGDDNQWGRWIIHVGVTMATNRLADLDGDGDCISVASSIYPSSRESLEKHDAPSRRDFHHSVAGALPESRTTWSVGCGSEGRKYMALKVEAAPEARSGGEESVSMEAGSGAPDAQGRWVYMYSPLPGSTVKLTHGVKSKSGSEASRGDATSSSNGHSHSFSAEASVDFYIHGSAKHKTWIQASSESSKKLVQSWQSTVVMTDTTEYSFTLPKDPASRALWQWQFEVVDSGGVVAQVLTRDMALTPSGSPEHRPRCFPGFCAPDDAPHYQKCVKGGELP